MSIESQSGIVVHLLAKHFTMINLYLDIYLTELEAIVVWRPYTIPSIIGFSSQFS